MPYNLFFENLSTVLPIFGVAFDERPAINIANIGLAVGSQKIKTANILTELLDDSIADIFFIRGQYYWVPHLFPFFISEDDTVKARRLPSLGIHIVRTDRIDLYVEGIRR